MAQVRINEASGQRIQPGQAFARAICLSLVVLAATTAAEACTIPVFRYALERWPADPYDIAVFHRGPLKGEAQSVVDWLKKVRGPGGAGANFRVATFDLSGELPQEVQALWDAQANATAPWLVASYPQTASVTGAFWAGPLTAEAAGALVDSPMRREIAREILEGQTAAWILLECGDAAKDEAAAKLLEDQLAILSKTLKIEVPDAEDISPQAGSASKLESELELRVAFSLRRLKRTDPAERMLVEMLLASEHDLKTFAEPIAFPVYGRGRALYALVGKGINAENIREACEFLIGWCSCQVKAENPGTDLLILADWDGALKTLLVRDVELPPLRGFSAVLKASSQPAAPVAPVAVAVAATEPTEARGSKLLLRVAVAIGLVVLATLVAIVLVFRKSEAN